MRIRGNFATTLVGVLGIVSITKMLTATAVLTLVDQGKSDLACAKSPSCAHPYRASGPSLVGSIAGSSETHLRVDRQAGIGLQRSRTSR